MSLQVKDLIQIIVKLRTEKNCTRFYHPQNFLLKGTKYCAPKQILRSNTLL